MSTLKELWQKLAASKRYREEFVSSQVKRGIPFQIRSLMKQHEMSQEELAKAAGLSQGVVSRAASPNYGNLTLNTLIRIAAGFDVAFVGRFVPFSDLGKWFTDLSEDSVQVPSFKDDSGFIDRKPVAVQYTVAEQSILAGGGTGAGNIVTLAPPENEIESRKTRCAPPQLVTSTTPEQILRRRT